MAYEGDFPDICSEGTKERIFLFGVKISDFITQHSIFSKNQIKGAYDPCINH